MSVVPLPENPATFLTDLDPNPIVILGQDRRILYANPAARALSAPHNGDRIEGLKLGEALRCIHSQDPAGCGDTPTCLYCGANTAVRAGLAGAPHEDECFITSLTADGDSISGEFSIRSRPVEWNGEPAVFCALNDVSHEKRRRILEHTFFHDILNTIGSVKGLSDILLAERGEIDRAELMGLLKMMHDSCDVIVDEIRSQQLLLTAESGQLTPNWTQVAIGDCMADAARVASHWPSGALKTVVPLYSNERAMFRTDPILLGRVLRNLLKNALEASPAGAEVRLTGRLAGSRVEFSVWNAGVIPEAARLQIFQRSVSTKGTGRGTGTYSVRLFTEVYLKGSVSFTSNSQDGTTFTVLFPAQPPA